MSSIINTFGEGGDPEIIRDQIINRSIQSPIIRGVVAALSNRLLPGQKSFHEDVWQNFVETKYCRMTTAQLIAFENRGIPYFRTAYKNYIIDQKRKQDKLPTIIPLITENKDIINTIQSPNYSGYDPKKIAIIEREITRAYGEKKAKIIIMTIDGFSSKEIAKRIGTTADAINNQRSKIRKDPNFIRIITNII